MSSTQAAPEQTASGNGASDVRSELLGMLDRVGAPPPKPMVRAPEQAAGKAPSVAVGSARAALKARPQKEEAPVDPDVTCVKCGNKDPWGTASWCPKCGYYPNIGHDGEIPQEESDGIEDLTFFDLCPPWALQIVGGLIFITVLTFGLEKWLTGNVGWLSLASLIQLSFGIVLILFAHKQAIMMSLRDPQCPGVMALITYPPAVWMPVLQHLRERAHLLVTLSWGLCASVMALSIYGPIHMSEIKKEIAESKKSKKSFMGKMLGTLAQVSAATQGPNSNVSVGGGPDSLEDAIGGFAGIATEQGGLGDIINGAQSGNVDAMMQQAVDSAVADAGGGGLNPGGLNIPNGGGGGGATSLDGAIGEFADVAAGQFDLDDPDDLAKLATSGVSGGQNSKAALQQNGGSSTSGQPDQPGRVVQPIAVASSSGTSTKQPGTTPRPVSRPSSTPGAPASAASFAPENIRKTVVFGYLLSAGGDIRTLLIASIEADGRPRFAGKIGIDAMQEAEWNRIIAALPEQRTRRPLVACPNSGYWVAPKFFLEVGTDRWAPTGPEDAQVLSIEER